MLKYNAEKYPDKEAIIYDTMAITYQKLFEDSYKKALHLMRFEGSRIAIYGPASYRWIVNMFGTILAGKDWIPRSHSPLANVLFQAKKKRRLSHYADGTIPIQDRR